MTLRMVGCSHHHAPLDLRERIAFSPAQARQALQRLREWDEQMEAVIVSTCNRTELYGAWGEDTSAWSEARWIDFLGEFHGLPRESLLPHLQSSSDRNVANHLFQVAASLDSLVVGETQILSQVKQSYDWAVQEGTVGPQLHQLFQHALFTAKRVSGETEIHRRRVSVASVAVSQIAMEFFERLSDKSILVIGGGELGEETLRYLVEAGARQIAICNRTWERSLPLAERYQGKAVAWEQLDEALREADLVISTTGSDLPIVTRDRFAGLWANRQRGPLVVLDLAVPRDFDAAIGQIDEVYLYTLDDVQKVCEANRQWRQSQWPKAQRIVEEEVEQFWQQLQHRGAIPTIRSLQSQAEAIKLGELQRLQGKLQVHQLDPAVQREIEQAFDRLVNKLLHPPLKSLREERDVDASGSLASAIRRIFRLKE
ncbi:MAG: glutamyl-tRNA reductase [Pirellulaceae bacterium]